MQIWLFDIDGTLIDTGGAGLAAMADTMALQFGTPADTRQVPFAGRTDRGITSDLFAAYAIEITDETFQRFHTSYLRQLPDSLRRHPGRVLPGVDQWLPRIQSNPRAHLGLLTGNFAEAARHKLEYYGLWDFFAFGGFGDHHTDRNEVAATALEAAAIHLEFSVDQVEVWVVGDTPRDVACARSIGANVIAVATGIHSPEELAGCEPDVLLPDLSDIGPLLEVLIEAEGEPQRHP